MQSGIQGIISGETGEIYQSVLDGVEYSTPSRFIGDAYRVYLARHESNASVNGRIFEYLVAETLVAEGIAPFYYQAKFALIPNAEFDIVLYHPQKPVVLTMKVSLRERYKQADLEGLALRNVYRGATSHLVTLHAKEAGSVARKIDSGDIVGLESCVVADSPAFDDLIKDLQKRQFAHAAQIMPLSSVYPVCDVSGQEAG